MLHSLLKIVQGFLMLHGKIFIKYNLSSSKLIQYERLTLAKSQNFSVQIIWIVRLSTLSVLLSQRHPICSCIFTVEKKCLLLSRHYMIIAFLILTWAGCKNLLMRNAQKWKIWLDKETDPTCLQFILFSVHHLCVICPPTSKRRLCFVLLACIARSIDSGAKRPV